MTVTESLASAVEQRQLGVFAVPDQSPETQTLHIKGGEILSYGNVVDVNRTDEFHVNGTSEALRVNTAQFLLAEPPLHHSREYSKTVQKWECYVIEAGSNTFWARMVTIMGEGPDQEAEIYVEDVDADDRALIEPGAVFYWSIGYHWRPSGLRRESCIRFRRLPRWTSAELDRVEAEAEKLGRLFHDD